MRIPIIFAAMAGMVLSDGQFQSGTSGAVFSDLEVGHWETDGPPNPVSPNIDGPGPHSYAHHDHQHMHDHSNEHHPHEPHHPHHHHLDIDSGEVFHHCLADGVTKEEKMCLCHQDNGLFQQICSKGQPCDPFTGRCQQRSCFDACRWANAARDAEGEAKRDACYTDTCGCEIPDEDLSEEEKCQLSCADCGPFPVQWPESPARKAKKHAEVMQDIFGEGLEHASDYNVRSMLPLETLSSLIF